MIHVELTGRAAITTETGRLEPPPEKTTALLYHLAHQADWVYRNDLLFLFYPDTDERKARQNLRALLTKVRRLSYVEGLVVEPTRLRWDVSTDVGMFREALAEGRLAQAYQQYRGELLEGFWLAGVPEFESWLELERDELQRQWRGASLAFTQELRGQERFEHAAEVLERLHRADPFDEEVLRSYLVALARAGRQPDALKAFEAFQALLQQEVNGEAEKETQQLVEQIRSGAALPEQDVKGETVARADTIKRPKLPIPATGFVGRKIEIESIMQRLRDPACRLLTIVGPGGMGKTRLALEMADRLTCTFKDGTCFVPFETVSAPEFMVSAVADALGITFSLHNLAICLSQSYGAYEEALDLLSEAIEIERLRGLEFRLAWWLNFQGNVLVYQGRFDEAETRYLEAKHIGETLEPGFGEWELEHALLGLGRVALLRGQHKKAAATLNGALDSSQRHPDPFGLKTEILRALAELAMKEKRFTDATALSSEALQALRSNIFEGAWKEAFFHFQLGEQALAKREVQEAGEQFRQALALAQEWSLLPATLHMFVGFAGLAKQHGKFEQAATLLAVAVSHSAGMFETISEARCRLETFPKGLVEVGLARAKDANPNEIAAKLLLGSATTA